MSTDGDTLGFVRPHARFAPAAQEAALKADGCRAIFRADVYDRAALIRLIRPGTILKLQHAFLLAEPTERKRPGAARSDFLKAMAEVEKRGGVIKDVDSGLTTADVENRYAIIERAAQLITSGGKGLRSAANGKKNRGRPARTWTPEEMAQAEHAWFDRRYLTNAEAEKHFPKGFSWHRAWRAWGPSGRVNLGRVGPKGPRLSPLRSWAPIPGCPTHEAHRSGQIRNARTRHVLTFRPLPSGYLRVSLPGRKDAYVHDLILTTFVGPRPKGTEASHKNGKNDDNRLRNLAWETPSENNQRKTAHGTAMLGERNPQGAKTHCPAGHAYDAAIKAADRK